MPSIIQVDKIIDGSATTNKELAEYSSGNWSWGSGVPVGTVLQVVTNTDNTEYSQVVNDDLWNYSELNTAITLKKANSKILVNFNFGAIIFRENNQLGYGLVRFKIGSGSYSNVTPVGANAVTSNSHYHHMAINYASDDYQVDAGASMIVVHTTSSAKDTVLTYAPYVYGENNTGKVFINRSERNATNDFSTISSCTLMEIAT